MPTANVPAVGPIHVPAFGPLTSPKVKTLGIVGALFVLQVFIWLGTVIVTTSNGSSPLFGGNWSSWSNSMLFYLIASLFAMGLIAYTPDLSLTPKYRDVSRFLVNYALWTFITWVALSLIYPSGSGAVPLLGNSRIQQFVFTSLFVAPTEELLFRVVLPRVLNSWVLGSVILFPLFHIPVELANYGVSNLTSVAGALIEITILGVVLWFIYSFVIKIRLKNGTTVAINSGYGGSTGFHSSFDLFVAGVLGHFPIGLVPI